MALMALVKAFTTAVFNVGFTLEKKLLKLMLKEQNL
jgi:hypothetical protein